ncbi:mitotic checkpoint serine/threonine-protein kinase BUB1 beta [Echeneis naucrates]|uniref:Mitotic checkpoint serine/threonine-protein kinase BUB1 beta-like n=1 Tax=Echeneis naucrates TaxID=173247 RepID=A0A665X9N8_ECHNA|nr:mitotic checkpoint serine/threonine-protein kinase BUB1 beta-like [Echeneis naucrates]
MQNRTEAETPPTFSGAAMAEGQAMQVGYDPTLTQSARQSKTHFSAGVGLQEEGGAFEYNVYCKELLMRGGEEYTFEELRAQRYFQQRQKEMDERLRHLKEVKEQLSQELEDKKRLLLLRTSQVVNEALPSQTRDSGLPSVAASSFQIYDETQSAATQPSGNSELPDDMLLSSDERRLCLRISSPPPPGESVIPVDDSAAQHSQMVVQSQTQELASAGHSKTTEDLQTRPPSVPQNLVSRTTKNLSPIQETSVEASSLTSLGEDQDQHQGEVEHVQSPGGAVDPCDPDVRQQLLNCHNVASCQCFHFESQPLPQMCSCLQLGDRVYHIYSRVLDGGAFSVYNGVFEDKCALIKVDSSCVPWDLHQFNRLKKVWSSAANPLPLISCFLFLDGCITIYTSPSDQMFTDLSACVPSDNTVGLVAVGLLQLAMQLHSCGLVHAALQPSALTCYHRAFITPDLVFPMDWSSSVDLELQQDVTSAQQLCSAQTYIELGLLEPTAPPQLLDLVGVAETVHVLLTNSKMVLVKDAAGWMPKQFSGDEPCDMFSRMWRRFFRALLNANSGSSLSILLELKEQLSTLYH